MCQWKWIVRLTYNNTVTWPKVPGELAVETRHVDDLSKDMEVEATKGRTDVDVVVMEYPHVISTCGGGVLSKNEFRNAIRSLPHINQMWTDIFENKNPQQT